MLARISKLPRVLFRQSQYNRCSSTTTSSGVASDLPAGARAEDCLQVGAPSPKNASAIIAGEKSVRVPLKAGDVVWWCACGRSSTQPFCDSSHKVCDIVPIKFTAEQDKTYPFCTCKLTNKAPICDGSHKVLKKIPQSDASTPASSATQTSTSSPP